MLCGQYEVVKDVAYLSSVINSNGDYSQEIKTRLRLRRAAMEELGKITKSKDVSLETKAKAICILIFPITMHGCGRRAVKKADGENIDSFEIWHWRRALQIPWTSRKMDKWILEQIKPETSLEAKMTKSKLSYVGHIMRRQVLWKRPQCWDK